MWQVAGCAVGMEARSLDAGAEPQMWELRKLPE